MLFVASTDTCETDQYKGDNLAIDKVAIIVDEPSLDAIVQVCNESAEKIELSRIQGILKNSSKTEI